MTEDGLSSEQAEAIRGALWRAGVPWSEEVARNLIPTVLALLETAWDDAHSAGRLDEFRDHHDILHVRAANPYRAHEMPTAGIAPTPEGPSAVREGTVERRTPHSAGGSEDAGPLDGRTRWRRCGTILGYGNVCGLPAGHADGCLPNEEQPS